MSLSPRAALQLRIRSSSRLRYAARASAAARPRRKLSAETMRWMREVIKPRAAEAPASAPKSTVTSARNSNIQGSGTQVPLGCTCPEGRVVRPCGYRLFCSACLVLHGVPSPAVLWFECNFFETWEEGGEVKRRSGAETRK